MNQPIKTLAEDTAIATGALAQSTVVPRFIHRDDMEAEGSGLPEPGGGLP